MYSPAINERLISILYREARARRVPMTRLVDRLLVKALESEELCPEAQTLLDQHQQPLRRAA